MDLLSVIEFQGGSEDIVWRSPIENFNTHSVLVVDETHEALLVVNGQACDLFSAGRHVLETSNIPIANKFINWPTNGQTTFPCKIFFINKVYQMDMTWGIPGEITLNDPQYDIFLHVGMCGNMNFQIEDARKFVLKMVGFVENLSNEDLVKKFRGIIKQYVKNYISKMMNVSKISYFDMNEHLFDVSNVVKEQLLPVFADYGVNIVNFFIETITVPDEDFAAVKKAKELKTARNIQGYTWQEEKQMDIAKTFAGNEGTAGNVGGAVGGFMVGSAISGNFAELARNAFAPISNNLNNNANAQNVNPQNANPQNSSQDVFCANCGEKLAGGMKFCPKCGTAIEKECPNCHTKLVANAQFCHNCGQKC